MLSVSYLPLPWHPRLSRQSAKDEGDMTMDSVASFTAAASTGTRVCRVFPKRTKRQTSEKGRPLVGFDSCSTLRYHLVLALQKDVAFRLRFGLPMLSLLGQLF